MSLYRLRTGASVWRILLMVMRASKWNKYNNIIAFYKEIRTMTILNTWRLATETLSRKPKNMTFLITNLYLWIGTCRCQTFIDPVHKILIWGASGTQLWQRLWCNYIRFYSIHPQAVTLSVNLVLKPILINKRSLQYGGFLMLTSKCILVSTEGQTLFWITRFYVYQ